jgi:signal transduction histidine kinase
VTEATARPGRRTVRRTLQMRLAATYGGLFFLLGLLVLAIPYFLDLESPTPSGSPASAGSQVHVPAAVLSAQHDADLHQQLVLSIVALVVLAALSGALGWMLAGRALRPLRQITTTAKEISASNLHQRLAVEGPYDELNELGATLDELLARLEAAFASQRHFVANASHELRTPLTAERTMLQLALDDPASSAASLREVCEELLSLQADQERLLNDLLTLAQSEGGADLPERFDLSALARTAVLSRQEEGSSRDVTIEASCLPAPVFGDRRLVTILVGNLVDNAIRHNVGSGHVTVRTSHSGRGATIAISNSGPVVAESDVAHLCEPFMRPAGAARLHGEGNGLGLAIVKAVADAHRAELRLRARAQGGLAVDVTFPTARNA